MKIAGYLKTSLIEWPGKIASVVFVTGCNLRCPFCHNRDLVDSKRFGVLPTLETEEILADLELRKKWIDGVVITGGEPTLQADLAPFLRRLKQNGFLTMLETNGTRPEVTGLLISSFLLDSLAMDIKWPFEQYQKYFKFLGFQLTPEKASKEIKYSLEIIWQSGKDYELRTTIVPGMHDERVINRMAVQLRGLALDLQYPVSKIKWVLQNFQPKNCLDPGLEKVKPFSKKQLQDILKAVKEILPQTELREA